MSFLFNGVTASVLVNCKSSVSLISSGFFRRLASSSLNDSVDTCVSVPSVRGTFSCMLSLKLSNHLVYDILLGSDWLALCHEAIMNGVVFLSTSEYVDVVDDGKVMHLLHRWSHGSVDKSDFDGCHTVDTVPLSVQAHVTRRMDDAVNVGVDVQCDVVSHVDGATRSSIHGNVNFGRNRPVKSTSGLHAYSEHVPIDSSSYESGGMATGKESQVDCHPDSSNCDHVQNSTQVTDNLDNDVDFAVQVDNCKRTGVTAHMSSVSMTSSYNISQGDVDPSSNEHTDNEHIHNNHNGLCLSSPDDNNKLNNSDSLSKPSGLVLVSDILLRNFQKGVHASVFSTDIKVLQSSLTLHGIPSDNLCIRECRKALLYHIFTGTCVNYKMDKNKHLSSPITYSACQCISQGFQTANELLSACIEIVLKQNEQSISVEHLLIIAEALSLSPNFASRHTTRRTVKLALQKYEQSHSAIQCSDKTVESYVTDMFKHIETLSKPALLALAASHHICMPLSQPHTSHYLRQAIMSHVSKGECTFKYKDISVKVSNGCSEVMQDCFPLLTDNGIHEHTMLDTKIHLLSSLVKKINANPLKRILDIHNISYSNQDNVHDLRKHLKKYISTLKKGKTVLDRQQVKTNEIMQRSNRLHEINAKWPQLISDSTKNKIVRLFREQTSSNTLSTFTCASCAEECLNSVCVNVDSCDINFNLLRYPESIVIKDAISHSKLSSTTECENIPCDTVLDPTGILKDDNNKTYLKVCKTCYFSLNANKVPALSLANHNFLGSVPNELKDLTVIEEAMIARCRSKCWVIQLKQDNQDIALPNSQRGMHGHIIIYPQQTSDIAKVLPPSLEDICTPICVIFVGSSPPSNEWLCNKAKPLAVRREKVRNALIWLKQNNALYKDVLINHSLLDSFEEEDIIPVQIQHVLPDTHSESLTSRYDGLSPLQNEEQLSNDSPAFQSVVITDVDGHASSNELRAAAVRHIQQKGGGYLQIPHGPDPVNEFFNPDLFPMIYPTLFPYGIGGFENRLRATPLTMKRQVKHLFSLKDRRFQEHYSFLFTAFNILQRRALLLHTSLKVKKLNFPSIAADFASVSPEAIHVVSERVARGDFETASTDEERKVLKLMKEVKIITANVPGSSAARVTMRNEIRGLMMDQGLPSFYITINPADVYNPLVKFLAGTDIDIDALLPDQVPKYHEQANLIAKNPAVAAKFFNIYMKAFISAILGYDPKGKNLDGGILGVVKAYYGCVEAQGRGTLHCHMVIWLQGGMDPNEIKRRISEEGDNAFSQRLLSFLDDTISTDIPDAPDIEVDMPLLNFHPCSIRGVDLTLEANDAINAKKKDLHNLSKKCQIHTHSATCYKYWKGPPHSKECRFELNENNTCLNSYIDADTGDICLRHINGLVNNFNTTILEAMRCNMDIKFIGSGPSAKAVLYYITDYITKSQLKAHVAYTALQLAVKKLGEFNPTDDDLMIHAKKLLQKCAYSMISHQELSAQQVCSYLMDYEDHFTSHKFQNLYWTSFENFINIEDPSAECTINKRPTDANDSFMSDNHEIEHGDITHFDLLNTIDETTNSDDNNEEIGVRFEVSGNLVAKANQVADYQCRNEKLHDICVWDFISQIEKVTKHSIHNKRKKDTNESDDFDDNNDNDTDNNDLSSHVGCDLTEFDLNIINNYLITSSCKKNCFSFKTDHIESNSHLLSIRNYLSRHIPVPIGPCIPRRDQESLYPRYCRLMLILFKPWFHASDLRGNKQSWKDAFIEFNKTCPDRFKKIMDNMQILHECRDSRDDHFSKKNQQNLQLNNISNQVEKSVHSNNEDDFGPTDINDELLLHHLQSIENSHSDHHIQGMQDILTCLHYAEKGGMFSEQLSSQMDLNDDNMSLDNIADYHIIPNLEDVWEQEYENRRKSIKGKQTDESLSSIGINSHIYCNVQQNIIEDGSQFRSSSTSSNNRIQVPSIHNSVHHTQLMPEFKSTTDLIINKYTLNTEQARAFRIITEHSIKSKPDPLHMYLGGPGGTGKSRVINALKEYFEIRNELNRFKVASYTGIAAKNISGMTLHSALCLNQFKNKGSKLRTLQDLITRWEGVDYLFIDEVSMIGCSFMLQISQALTEAKQNTLAFGGINIIFAGDFSQLPPVGETRLFSHINPAKVNTKKGQNDVLGKLLWLSFTTVVILSNIQRQSDPIFIDLLNRLRFGKCNDKDFDLLSTRILGNFKPDWNDPNWENATCIVSNNNVKDALNIKATKAFAIKMNRDLHWYYATDTHQGNKITDSHLKEHLEQLHSGHTNQRLGKIPLVLGMPVIISQNFDVHSGIVNGCTGTLKKIRYKIDANGNRHATSCIIHAPLTTGKSLPHLSNQHVAILEDTTDMRFINPYSQKKCTIKRTQVPILPGFAITAHKAQGQTLSNVIVDLQSCRGTESPYVMVSRVTSLEGLIILRPFDKRKIQCRQSEDSREEMKRLNILHLQTKIKFSSDDELLTTENALADLTHMQPKENMFIHTNHLQNMSDSTSGITAHRAVFQHTLSSQPCDLSPPSHLPQSATNSIFKQQHSRNHHNFDTNPIDTLQPSLQLKRKPSLNDNKAGDHLQKKSRKHSS